MHNKMINKNKEENGKEAYQINMEIKMFNKRKNKIIKIKRL
jgi:hypothetical protein